MELIIAGSRELPVDGKRINMDMLGFPLDEIECVLSGHSGKVDLAGEIWAKDNCIPVKLFTAKWDIHGKAAGPIRNREMAQEAAPDGMLLAYWDKKSRGTENMIHEAIKRELWVRIIPMEYED